MLWVQLGKPAPHLFYWRIPILGVPAFVNFRKAPCAVVARSDTLAHCFQHPLFNRKALVQHALNSCGAGDFPPLHEVNRPVVNELVYLVHRHPMECPLVTANYGLAPKPPTASVLWRSGMNIDGTICCFPQMMRFQDEAVVVRNDQVVVRTIHRRQNVSLCRGVSHFPKQNGRVFKILLEYGCNLFVRSCAGVKQQKTVFALHKHSPIEIRFICERNYRIRRLGAGRSADVSAEWIPRLSG